MNKLFNILVLTLATLGLTAAQAATVKAVKENKAIIEIQDETLSPGDQFFLITEAGKKTALITIKQVKGNRALAEITKGKGRPGQTLLARTASAAPAASAKSAPKNTSQGDYAEDFIRRSRIQEQATVGVSKKLRSSWGLLGGLSMNSMDAKVAMRDTNNNTVIRTSAPMTGTSFGLGGFYDMALSSSLALHLNGAYEMFSATGKAAPVSGTPVPACNGSTDCKADISYLSGYSLLKWYPNVESKYRFWGGGGFGYMMKMGSSSNALASIGPTPVYTAGIGMDIQFSREKYMPLSLQYSMFPSSPTVSANMIVLKLGWAWNR